MENILDIIYDKRVEIEKKLLDVNIHYLDKNFTFEHNAIKEIESILYGKNIFEKYYEDYIRLKYSLKHIRQLSQKQIVDFFANEIYNIFKDVLKNNKFTINDKKEIILNKDFSLINEITKINYFTHEVQNYKYIFTVTKNLTIDFFIYFKLFDLMKVNNTNIDFEKIEEVNNSKSKTMDIFILNLNKYLLDYIKDNLSLNIDKRKSLLLEKQTIEYIKSKIEDSISQSKDYKKNIMYNAIYKFISDIKEFKDIKRNEDINYEDRRISIEDEINSNYWKFRLMKSYKAEENFQHNEDVMFMLMFNYGEEITGTIIKDILEDYSIIQNKSRTARTYTIFMKKQLQNNIFIRLNDGFTLNKYTIIKFLFHLLLNYPKNYENLLGDKVLFEKFAYDKTQAEEEHIDNFFNYINESIFNPIEEEREYYEDILEKIHNTSENEKIIQSKKDRQELLNNDSKLKERVQSYRDKIDFFNKKLENYYKFVIETFDELLNNEKVIDYLLKIIQKNFKAIFYNQYYIDNYTKKEIPFVFDETLKLFILVLGEEYWDHKFRNTNYSNFMIELLKDIPNKEKNIIQNKFFKLCSMYYELNSYKKGQIIRLTNNKWNKISENDIFDINKSF